MEGREETTKERLFPKPSPELPNSAVFRRDYLIPNRPGCFTVSAEAMGLSKEFMEDPVGWMITNFGDREVPVSRKVLEEQECREGSSGWDTAIAIAGSTR